MASTSPTGILFGPVKALGVSDAVYAAKEIVRWSIRAQQKRSFNPQ